jgi:ribonuclease R
MLEHNHAKLRKKYNAVLPDLEQMYALYKAMRGQREIRGAMDFDTQETQIVFAEDRSGLNVHQVYPLCCWSNAYNQLA